jgi:hypothetical protein
MLAEQTATNVDSKNVAVINSVGAMRALQQTWLASMHKAAATILACEKCESIDLTFSYEMTETFFYDMLNQYAKNTFYKSDKESLDYKILVLKEDIKDGSKVKLSSGTTVTVPVDYIQNLKTNYPLNYEKNLKADGSIKFEPLTCDASIELKSIPAILKAKGEKVYKITKESANKIMKSECAKFFN